MKFKLLGRIALLVCVSVGVVCSLTSCATSTLGYLYVTAVQYGQVASLRLDINTGQIKSVRCNTGNGDQSDCITSSGGQIPTKIVLANSETLMYVLNVATTSPTGTPIPASIALLTLGPSGSVYTSGQSYQSSGQDPLDMYLSPTGNFLYVLDQYRPADQAGCATPTPSTCMGDISVFSIDSKGDLTPVLCGSGDGCLNGSSTQDQSVFPINYEPGPLNSGYGGSRMLASASTFYVLDESAPGTPEIHTFGISSASGALQPTSPTATSVPGAKQLSSIVAGNHIYVSDYQTGEVRVFQASGASGLTQLTVVCPSSLSAPGTACTANAGSNTGKTVALDAMITSGSYLYAADYANNTVFAMQDTGAGTILTATDGGNNTAFGTNTTCLTLSSSPEFLYGSGNGTVVGYQINTSTGGLSTNLNPSTATSFTGVVPCVAFTPRT